MNGSAIDGEELDGNAQYAHWAGEVPPPRYNDSGELRVFVVPPPRALQHGWRNFAVVFAIIAALSFLTVWSYDEGRRASALGFAIVLGMLSPLMLISMVVDNFAHRAVWRRFQKCAPPRALHSFENCLAREWKRPGTPPSAATVARVAREEFGETPPPIIVGFGLYPHSEASDDFFEPHFASNFAQPRVSGAAIGPYIALLVVVLLLIWWGGIASRFGRIGLICLLAFPAIWLSIAIWGILIGRTTYRFSPGRIDILSSGFLARRMRARSYPVTPGTIWVLKRADRRSTLVLWRDGRASTISMQQLTPLDRDMLRRALFSTARVPVLPEQELLG